MHTTRRVFSGNEGNETTKFINPYTEQFFAWPQRNYKVREIWNPETTSSGDDVLRFVKAVKHKTDGRIEGDSLSANEIDEAHTVWMNGMQRTLPEKGEFEHWKVKFDLYRDEKNVWRCKGRFGKGNFLLITKHPIILDMNHYLTTLIIRECH
jgi:hypothetical protein